MSITERAYVVTDITDGDKTWEPDHILTGVLEVTSNSSPSIKTFPAYSTIRGTDRVQSGDSVRLLVRNRGIADLTLAANAGSIADFLEGDPVIPAGEFRQVQLVFGYDGAAVLGIFVGG